jgi:inorganic pyrophosphatase
MFCVVGLAHGTYNILSVVLKEVEPIKAIKKREEKEIQENSNTFINVGNSLNDNEAKPEETLELTEEKKNLLVNTAQRISDGANTFLFREYLYLAVFVFFFAIIVFLTAETKMWTFYTTMAFIIGSVTSIVCGFIGMKIATAANYRTTFTAYQGLGAAFSTAYHGGCVMGFILVSLSLAVLMTLILVYRSLYLNEKSTLQDERAMFESIAGYGLGGSLVALFCRVGGGIYTKAADVGADLVGKVESGLDEDDPTNPAVIADNVGDNVGDIAGMGSDLFGSLAESLCAALLVGATSPELISSGCFYYPLLIVAFGIVVSIITSFFAFIFSSTITNYDRLEWTIKLQIIISTVLLIPTIVLVSIYCLPEKYSVGDFGTVAYKSGVTNYATMVCPLAGLISGMLIGLSTEYYTSMSFTPVRSLVEGCKQGSAINIILGLALGYLSCIIPTVLIAGTVLVAYSIAGMYGIALSALGMLANLPICLAIDGYGPISDNAGGLAALCDLPPQIRATTDDLDSAGNTTAAIGKGFAIGSACLVALSLFGAFVTKVNLKEINALLPITLTGLILGAMMPYLFSALTMKAVGSAAGVMVKACKEGFNDRKAEADRKEELEKERQEKKTSNADTTEIDHELKILDEKLFKIDSENSEKCIAISTENSLLQMFLPGLIIIFTPIVFGVLFSPKCVAGYLIGLIVSGIQLAISASNSGGAWDNAKKLIKTKGLPVTKLEEFETEKLFLNSYLQGKKIQDRKEKEEMLAKVEAEIRRITDNPNNKDTKEQFMLNFQNENDKLSRPGVNKMKKQAEKASIIGDTVGDPMKDTSGPSLNILIKLSSIISVIFGTFFVKTSYLIQ